MVGYYVFSGVNQLVCSEVDTTTKQERVKPWTPKTVLSIKVSYRFQVDTDTEVIGFIFRAGNH